MSLLGGLSYVELFGVAFMLGGGFFFFYQLLCHMGRWIPFLSQRSVKGFSITTATAAMAAFFWFYYDDFLTCDGASQAIAALRAEPPAAGSPGVASVRDTSVERYCTYYRDHCLTAGKGTNNPDWQFCLRQERVSPPI